MSKRIFGRIADSASRSGGHLLAHLLPERCCLCLQSDTAGYCLPCQQLLPWVQLGCERCGTPMTQAGICGNCQNRLPPWNQMLAPFHYQVPIARHLHLLKYQGRLYHAAALGKMLAQHVVRNSLTMPEVIIPVPLHPIRLRQRGFNQAELLALELGRLLQIPVDNRWVQRIRHTPSQTTLDQATRAKNMQNAFAVTTKERYDAVAVVDDVVTSGATLRALANQIRRSGTKNISAWAIAKT